MAATPLSKFRGQKTQRGLNSPRFLHMATVQLLSPGCSLDVETTTVKEKKITFHTDTESLRLLGSFCSFFFGITRVRIVTPPPSTRPHEAFKLSLIVTCMSNESCTVFGEVLLVKTVDRELDLENKSLLCSDRRVVIIITLQPTKVKYHVLYFLLLFCCSNFFSTDSGEFLLFVIKL